VSQPGKEQKKGKDEDKDDASSEYLISSSGTSSANTRKQQTVAGAPPLTRIRRPSIRSSHHASRSRPATLSTSSADPIGFNINGGRHISQICRRTRSIAGYYICTSPLPFSSPQNLAEKYQSHSDPPFLPPSYIRFLAYPDITPITSTSDGSTKSSFPTQMTMTPSYISSHSLPKNMSAFINALAAQKVMWVCGSDTPHSTSLRTIPPPPFPTSSRAQTSPPSLPQPPSPPASTPPSIGHLRGVAPNNRNGQ
jgi:hypothetical protein